MSKSIKIKDRCSICGKAIFKGIGWLDGVRVKFKSCVNAHYQLVKPFTSAAPVHRQRGREVEMGKPNPNCENCGGSGKVPAVNLDVHGDGMHDCFCIFDEPSAPADVCPRCQGTKMEPGEVHYPAHGWSKRPCKACHGSGRKPTEGNHA